MTEKKEGNRERADRLYREGLISETMYKGMLATFQAWEEQKHKGGNDMSEKTDINVVEFPKQSKEDHEEKTVKPRSLSEKYPEGMNEILLAFYEAAYEILSTNEIDKIIASSKEEEVENLTALRDYFKANVKNVSEVPHWLILVDVLRDSPSLYPDILVYMISKHGKVCIGQELEKRLSYKVARKRMKQKQKEDQQ